VKSAPQQTIRGRNSPGLLVDQARNALDATTASQTANGGLSLILQTQKEPRDQAYLGDALDVVAEDLAVALGSALAQTFTSCARIGSQDGRVQTLLLDFE
jgi:hypothetical protein